MSLQQKLDDYKKQFQAKAPSEKAKLMGKATAELKASGILEHVVKEGERAPDFSLSDARGNPLSLPELKAKGPVVLTFYRGVW